MMQLLTLRPILWTDQLEESIVFYTSVLGFELAEKNTDWGWASLYRDEVGIMLALPNGHISFTGAVFTGSFYFTVPDVDAWWDSLRGKVKVCYPPETFDWGMKEFAIYDNNGYILQMGQVV